MCKNMIKWYNREHTHLNSEVQAIFIFFSDLFIYFESRLTETLKFMFIYEQS